MVLFRLGKFDVTLEALVYMAIAMALVPLAVLQYKSDVGRRLAGSAARELRKALAKDDPRVIYKETVRYLRARRHSKVALLSAAAAIRNKQFKVAEDIYTGIEGSQGLRAKYRAQALTGLGVLAFLKVKDKDREAAARSAMEFFELAVDVDPELGDAQANLGLAQFILGDQAAADTLEKAFACELPPSLRSLGAAYFASGQLAMQAGDFVKAYEDFRRATALDSRDDETLRASPVAHLMRVAGLRAVAFAKMNQKSRHAFSTRARAERWVEALPRDQQYEGWLLMGLTYEALGRSEDTLLHYFAQARKLARTPEAKASIGAHRAASRWPAILARRQAYREALVKKDDGGEILQQVKIKRKKRRPPPHALLEVNEESWVKQAEHSLLFYQDNPAAQSRLLRAIAEIRLLQAACFPPKSMEREQQALERLEACVKLGEKDAALLRRVGILAFRRSLYILRTNPREAELLVNRALQWLRESLNLNTQQDDLRKALSAIGQRGLRITDFFVVRGPNMEDRPLMGFLIRGVDAAEVPRLALSVEVGGSAVKLMVQGNQVFFRPPPMPQTEDADVVVRCTRRGGKEVTETFRLEVDRDPPRVVATVPPAGESVKGPFPTLRIILEDSSGIAPRSVNITMKSNQNPIWLDKLVHRGRFRFSSQGKFKYKRGHPVDVPEIIFTSHRKLLPGTYSVSVDATDNIGNKMKKFRWTLKVSP